MTTVKAETKAKTKAKSAELLNTIIQWIDSLDHYPGWKVWQRKKMAAVLSDAEGIPLRVQLQDFDFPEPIRLQHEAVMSFMSLWSSLEALKDCQYYFRRFPFRGLPVSKHAHVRYICEMYFNRFYEFRERLKRCLNAANLTIDVGQLNVGAALKAFSREFDQELRARNSIHHHDEFDDIAIQGISLATLIGMGDDGARRGWKDVASRSYRTTTREWAQRVEKRSKRVEEFLEAIADAILSHCTFLSFPVEAISFQEPTEPGDNPNPSPIS